MASKFFSKIQYGKETIRGTAVAADTIWDGQISALVSDVKPVFPEEQFGVREKARRSVIYQKLVQDTLRSSHGTFQQLLPLFGCGLVGGVTAAEQTPAQSDFLWDFTPDLTAANDPDSLTIEKGDDQQAYEAEYCMFERIRISGNTSQGNDAAPVAIEADFFGRQWTETTFTAALALDSPESMNAKLARIYLDTAWAGVGGTEKTDILRGFQIEILTGVHPKFAGSANQYFNAHAEGYVAAMASFTFERGAASKAMFDNLRAEDLVVVRLQINGSQIGTGDNHSLVIDIGGKFEDVSPMNSDDRDDWLDTATLKQLYDPTGALALQVQVTTDTDAY